MLKRELQAIDLLPMPIQIPDQVNNLGADAVTTYERLEWQRDNAAIVAGNIERAHRMKSRKPLPFLGGGVSERKQDFYDAVDAQQVQFEQTCQDLGVTQEKLSDDIAAARQRLLDFTPAQRQELVTYVAQRGPELYALQQVEAAQQGMDWFEWLTAEDEVSELHLLRLVSWHAEQMDGLQNHWWIQKRVGDIRSKFKATIAQGVKEGVWSELAETALPLVDSTRVYLTDPFNPQFTQGSIAYHPRNTDYVVVGATIVDGKYDRDVTTSVKLDKTLCHELAHATIQTPGILDDDPFLDRVMEEVGAEQAKLVVYHGAPHIIDPHERGEFISHHPAIRSACAEALKGPYGTVPATWFTRAYSGTNEEKQALLHRVDSAWKMDNAMSTLFQVGMRRGVWQVATEVAGHHDLERDEALATHNIVNEIGKATVSHIQETRERLR